MSEGERIEQLARELSAAAAVALELLAGGRRRTAKLPGGDRIAGTCARSLIARGLAAAEEGSGVFAGRRLIAITDRGRAVLRARADLRISASAPLDRPARWSGPTTCAGESSKSGAGDPISAFASPHPPLTRDTQRGETEGGTENLSTEKKCSVIPIFSTPSFCTETAQNDVALCVMEEGMEGKKGAKPGANPGSQLDLFGGPARPPREPKIYLDQMWMQIVGCQPGPLGEVAKRLRELAAARGEPLDQLVPRMLDTFRRVMDARERRYRSYGPHALIASGTWEEVQLVMDGRQPLNHGADDARARSRRGSLAVVNVPYDGQDDDP